MAGVPLVGRGWIERVERRLEKEKAVPHAHCDWHWRRDPGGKMGMRGRGAVPGRPDCVRCDEAAECPGLRQWWARAWWARAWWK